MEQSGDGKVELLTVSGLRKFCEVAPDSARARDARTVREKRAVDSLLWLRDSLLLAGSPRVELIEQYLGLARREYIVANRKSEYEWTLWRDALITSAPIQPSGAWQAPKRVRGRFIAVAPIRWGTDQAFLYSTSVAGGWWGSTNVLIGPESHIGECGALP